MTTQYPRLPQIRADGGAGAPSGFGPLMVNRTIDHNPDVAATVEFIILQNDSGARVTKGSSVKLALGAGRLAFTTSTTQGDARVIGITLDDIAASARGRVALSGHVKQARVAAGSTTGQILRQSTTAGVLEGTDGFVSGSLAVQMSSRDATSGFAEVEFIRPQTTSASSYTGDGSDGAVTISADTTLTRDMYYSSLTVQSGKTLTTAGFRIFCQGTLSCAGTISNSGTNGATGAAFGAGGTGGAAGSLGGGTNGGAGAAPGGAGTNSTNNVGAAGGAGGSAGLAGGAAGTVAAPTAAVGGTQVIKNFPNSITLRDLSAAQLNGGTGGGGGCSGGGTVGGGGGGGGGVIMIAASVVTGAGAIRANGGAGGAGDVGSGGGGGGGGGFVVLITGSSSSITPTATGGALGAAGGGGGNAGVAGSNGTVLQLVV